MSEALISGIYSGAVDGVWLDGSPISRFSRDGVTLTAYGNQFDQWHDRSGNARNPFATALPASDALAVNRDTSYYGANITSQYNTGAAGGSTTAFYAAFSLDARSSQGATQYYSTIFDDVNFANDGVRLTYNGDDGGYYFSVGTGSARVQVFAAQGTGNFTYEGRNVVECWHDGTNIGIRVNFGTPTTTTCAAISAGTLPLHFWPSWLGDIYEIVLFKNYCPNAADRNRIASYMGKQQLISLPPSGDFTVTESGSDTFASTGNASNNRMAATETGADTFASTGGTLVRTGSMAATEGTVDTFSAVQSPGTTVPGFAFISEYGVKDTFASASAASPRSGIFAATESGADTFAAAGSVLPNRTGTMAAVESSTPDVFAATSATAVTGTMALTETGADVFAVAAPVSSDAAFLAWLATDSKIATVLVEVVARVGGVETTRYLSSTGYTDGVANRHYLGLVTAGGTTTEELPEDGSASIAFGDIEVSNVDGSLDSWLGDVWVGRTCKVYVGDQRWARADFRLIFDGVVADLQSRDKDVLNIVMRDKLQRLNTAMSETKLGGTSQNADQLIPISLGEQHNISPLLIDKATLKYQFNNGASERLIEVRDYGVPVSATAQLTAGTFTLNQSPAGTITASVQGNNVGGYTNRVSPLIQKIVQNFGTDPFVSGDLDANNLATFDAAHPQPVGVYLPDRENVLDVCQRLASSVGAQLVMPATGKLRLVKVTFPATSTPTAVSTSNILERSLEVSSRRPVRAAVKLGYCRNWTVQENLQTGIVPEHKDLFAKEWLTVTSSNSTVATIYKQSQEPEQEDTLLLVTGDATNEAARRRSIWETQRTVYRYDGAPELLTQELGGYQTITYPRFGLDAGATGQIVRIERDWLNARVRFEVLV